MSKCIEFKAPVVVEWEVNNEKHHLVDPDPRSASVTFEGRFYDDVALCSFFQLHIPSRLRGVTRDTTILVPIYPDAIVSLDAERFPSVPAIVDKKLRCSCTCLRFQLRRPVRAIVSVAASTPLKPFRNPTGDVLDRLRSLVQVTSLGVYVPDLELSSAKLQTIQAKLETLQKAFSRTRSKPPVHDLVCLFNGTGGQIIDSLDESPPSYDQIGPAPPWAPINESKSDPKPELQPEPQPSSKPNDKKRRRRDSPSPEDTDSRFEAIWAELRKKDEKIEQLERRVKQLEHDKEEGDDEAAALRLELDRVVAVNEDLEGQLLLTKEKLDDLVDEVVYIQENGLDSDVEERIVETVTDCVFEQISENATVTFTRS